MQEYQKYFRERKIAALILVVAVLIAGLTVYFAKYYKPGERKVRKEVEIETPAPQAPVVVAPEEVGAGKIGETEETFKGEEKVVLPPEPGGPVRELPSAIFNDSGTVKEIKKDSLVILSSGYSFADQQPREVTLKFTETTITNSADKTKKWIGLAGLKNLQVGDSITFESPENIRGKIEFIVSYLNQL